MAESKNLLVFNDEGFAQDVLASEAPVLVDFWAEWCGPCLRLGPTIAELAEDLAGKVRVGKLNVDDNPETAQKYRVMSIPTVVIFKKGAPVKTLVGLQPKAQYVKALEEAAR